MEGVLDLREKLAKLMYGEVWSRSTWQSNAYFRTGFMRAFVICPKTFVRDYLLYFTYFNYFDVYKNVFKKYSETLPGE